MFVNDPIADLLARIRNAQQRKRQSITVPSSKMLKSIADILSEEGFVESVTVHEQSPQDELEIVLRYQDDEPAIRGMQRVSKPGVRRYVGYKEIPVVKNGLGACVLSTPKGVMTGDQAKNQKVGGEYLFNIY